MTIVAESVPFVSAIPAPAAAAPVERLDRRDRLEAIAVLVAELAGDHVDNGAARDPRSNGPAAARLQATVLVAELAALAARASRRRVIVQDMAGHEMTSGAPAETVARPDADKTQEWCRTVPLTSRGRRVGRIWFGPGPALAGADTDLLHSVELLLGALFGR